ncbi:DUF7563 family protein [Natrarchaeobaculum sulfurireducens]
MKRATDSNKRAPRVSGGTTMPECQNCGSHVTARFERVFGDNDGNVHGCRECMGTTEIVNGEATRGP